LSPLRVGRGTAWGIGVDESPTRVGTPREGGGKGSPARLPRGGVREGDAHSSWTSPSQTRTTTTRTRTCDRLPWRPPASLVRCVSYLPSAPTACWRWPGLPLTCAAEADVLGHRARIVSRARLDREHAIESPNERVGWEALPSYRRYGGPRTSQIGRYVTFG